jgi:hypothetical protein
MSGRRACLILVPLLLVLVALAGCTSGGVFDREPVRSTKFLAFGEPESAYGGLGLGREPSEVSKVRMGVAVELNDAEDFGSVVMGGLTPTDQRFYLRLESFNATDDYQDGGIAANLALHGETGRGDGRFPELEARMAGWGNASLRVEDIPYANPVTGAPWWPALVYVLDAGVHDDETHAIRSADGSAPYDPARPEDAAVDPDAREIMLVLWTHEGTWEGPATTFPVFIASPETPPLADPQYDQEETFFNTAWGTRGVFEVELTTQTPALTASDMTFTFESPSGDEVGSVTLGGVDGPRDNATVRFSMDELGTYRVRVTGEAVAVSYRILGSFEADDPITASYHWEDTLRGKNAQTSISEWRLEEEFAQIGGEPGDPILSQVDEPTPPTLNLAVVLLGVAGALVTCLLVVKMVLDGVKAKELKEAYQKDQK